MGMNSDSLCPFKNEGENIKRCQVFCPIYTKGNIKLIVKLNIMAKYEGGDGSWILNEDESKADILYISPTNSDVEIIAPKWEGKIYKVINVSGKTVTIKKEGGTGVSIPAVPLEAVYVKYVTDDYVSINVEEEVILCDCEFQVCKEI